MGETGISELLERCRKATGPDRSLQADIYLALMPDLEGLNSGFEGMTLRDAAAKYREADPDYWPVVTHTYAMEDILNSIDAAHALLEQKLGDGTSYPVEMSLSSVGAEGWRCFLWLGCEEDGQRPPVSPTPPLAICCALLAALIAREAQP